MIYFKPLTEVEEWDWIWSRAYPIACSDTQGLVAYDEDGNILAGAVFDSFTADGCSVHFAIDNPLVIRRGFLHEIARHLFIACGRNRIFGLVPANNHKALKFDTHLGMKEVARIPHGYQEDIDYIVLCMEKRECRWLPEELREAA